MADDHPSGEVRPVIVRDVLDATETQGASVGMRFCAASATGFVPPEPCQSLRNGGSSASGAGNRESWLRGGGAGFPEPVCRAEITGRGVRA